MMLVLLYKMQQLYSVICWRKRAGRRNLHAMFVWEKFKTLCWISNWIHCFITSITSKTKNRPQQSNVPCMVGVWGQTADNKQTQAAWCFLSFFYWTKQAVGRWDFSKPVSKTHLADTRSFPLYGSFNCLLLFSISSWIWCLQFLILKINSVQMSHHSFTNNIFLNYYWKIDLVTQ